MTDRSFRTTQKILGIRDGCVERSTVTKGEGKPGAHGLSRELALYYVAFTTISARVGESRRQTASGRRETNGVNGLVAKIASRQGWPVWGVCFTPDQPTIISTAICYRHVKPAHIHPAPSFCSPTGLQTRSPAAAPRASVCPLGRMLLLLLLLLPALWHISDRCRA